MPVTLNGRTWALSDFAPWGFRQNWMPFFEDLVAELSGFQGGTLRDQAAASAASAASSAAQAQTLVGQAGTGTATGLVYGSALKSLVTAGDVVSVFVYDTRRDSDGGAWVEKCRGTSWYNEPLNTATRGATRRFPTVALIVTRAASLTIYDAHDLGPDGAPRMWMLFNGSPNGVPVAVSNDPKITAVTAAQGRLYIGTSGGPYASLHVVDFPADLAERHAPSGTYRFAGTIGGRHQQSGWPQRPVGSVLGGANIASISAAVLPSAPLDRAGLPIPTVAVATAGGVSVIHPWGAMVSLTDANGYARVYLTSTGRLFAARVADPSLVDVGTVPYRDAVATQWRSGFYSGPGYAGLLRAASGGSVTALTENAQGSTAGLRLVQEDVANPANGLIAHVTNSYATGWQPGDIRGTWLGDSATGSISASGELVTNGDFASGTTGWSGVNSTLSVNNGQLVVTRVASGNAIADFTLSVVPGQACMIRVDASKGTTIGSLNLNVSDGGSGAAVLLADTASSSSATLGGQFIPTGNLVTIRLFHNGTAAGDTAMFDNVSVRAVLPDRSYKGKGLRVNGSLQRTGLPCGLSAITGFSAANYLEQAYNPDLDFGSGDFNVTFWVNPGGGNAAYVTRSGAGFDSGSWSIDKISGALTASLSGQFTLQMPAIPTGVWGQVSFGRAAGRWYLYYNGAEVAFTTAAATASLTGAGKLLRVGLSSAGDSPAQDASIALLRISATAPSPAQIRKIYDDERALFQAGQPALLGGTSNNVTALSANPDTGTLAVGTGDGVSVFAGLSRIAYHDGANTAGAVGSDNVTSVSAVGPHLLVGTAANAGLMTEARIARDLMRPGTPALPPPAPQAVTVDATPTDLSPRLYVGEGEVRTVRSLLTARQYGGTAPQVAAFELRYQVRRDVGGALALVGAAAVTVINRTSSSLDATVSVDTSAQTVTERVTGLAGTRLVWTVARQVQALTMGDDYAAQ
ncbi:LamG-like jellyroll fold domain-containing protein [Niveispirillum sp. BGYR6]|uniref:LamG-like jellyroll fold domain-containing protein n=1 Tax=Niveispirillum sp. BGYR6 TaxID=2971249 RepID=UPI0022B95090|nr:LamG-like jellyroll fold domain-containing protein [Niveispirillum sp. BGYR6]MDG5497425.1 hypothetical protein [Niveispirillum sp. BGYR6]